jgi:hypothetical protein
VARLSEFTFIPHNVSPKTLCVAENLVLYYTFLLGFNEMFFLITGIITLKKKSA